MNNLDIKVPVKKLLDYSASLKSTIPEETLLLMIESFSHYVKRLYFNLICEAVNSRDYKGNWEPIDDEGYQEYLGMTPEGNILDSIEDALEVRKIGYNFIVRFNPNYLYPNSRIRLLKVLRAIDSGTSDFNARPIFRKIIANIRDNILVLWRVFLSMKGVV